MKFVSTEQGKEMRNVGKERETDASRKRKNERIRKKESKGKFENMLICGLP